MALVGRRLICARAGFVSRVDSRLLRCRALLTPARQYSSEPGGQYRYSKSHEWALLNGKTATVGISNYAQEKLGEIVFVELSKVQGSEVFKGDTIGVFESVKAAAEVYAPLGGKVTAVNKNLESEPQLVNESSYDKGWIMKIEVKDTAEYDKLLSSEDYQRYLTDELSVS